MVEMVVAHARTHARTHRFLSSGGGGRTHSLTHCVVTVASLCRHRDVARFTTPLGGRTIARSVGRSVGQPVGRSIGRSESRSVCR